MVLGLTPEAYAVMYCDSLPPAGSIVASISGSFLFFTSFNAAKEAVQVLLSLYELTQNLPPKYIWIQPISKLWVDGEN